MAAYALHTRPYQGHVRLLVRLIRPRAPRAASSTARAVWRWGRPCATHAPGTRSAPCCAGAPSMQPLASLCACALRGSHCSLGTTAPWATGATAPWAPGRGRSSRRGPGGGPPPPARGTAASPPPACTPAYVLPGRYSKRLSGSHSSNMNLHCMLLSCYSSACLHASRRSKRHAPLASTPLAPWRPGWPAAWPVLPYPDNACRLGGQASQAGPASWPGRRRGRPSLCQPGTRDSTCAQPSHEP
jgi:hypothetical protein